MKDRYSVHCNFVGFQFLYRSQMIQYFVGSPSLSTSVLKILLDFIESSFV